MAETGGLNSSWSGGRLAVLVDRSRVVGLESWEASESAVCVDADVN